MLAVLDRGVKRLRELLRGESGSMLAVLKAWLHSIMGEIEQRSFCPITGSARKKNVSMSRSGEEGQVGLVEI